MTNMHSFFSKSGIFERYAENPGKMLLHTGTVGWILSCLAQVSAIIFNDKISPEQKSFLIPQELADGAINIASFYILTSSFKNFASKLASCGKLTTKAIKDGLIKNGVKASDIGKFDFDIGKFKAVEKDYKPFKNGVDVIAGTVGSIISCNLITPILRNQYASKRQKELIEKMNKYNKPSLQTPYPRTSMSDFQRTASSRYSLKV